MENIMQILPYLAPILSAAAGIKWGGLILDKLNIKTKKNQVEGENLDNIKKNLDLYQELVDDLNVKYKASLIDFEANFISVTNRLKSEISVLRELNNEMELMIKDQKLFIIKQSKSLTYYEHKYGNKKE